MPPYLINQEENIFQLDLGNGCQTIVVITTYHNNFVLTSTKSESSSGGATDDTLQDVILHGIGI